jgi:hypothetical protein
MLSVSDKPFMLSAIMLNVVWLSVIMLSVIMPSVIMLSAIMPSVLAPIQPQSVPKRQSKYVYLWRTLGTE